MPRIGTDPGDVRRDTAEFEAAEKGLARKVFQAGIAVSHEVIKRALEIHEGKRSHFDDRGPELKDFIGAVNPVIIRRESMAGGYDLEMTFVDPIEAGELSVLFSEDTKPFRRTQVVFHLTGDCPALDEIRKGVDLNPYVTAIRFEEGVEVNVGTSRIVREESAGAYRVDDSGDTLSVIALKRGGLANVDVDAEIKLSGSQSFDDGQRYGVVKGGRSPLPEGVTPKDVVEKVLQRFDVYFSNQNADSLGSD